MFAQTIKRVHADAAVKANSMSRVRCETFSLSSVMRTPIRSFSFGYERSSWVAMTRISAVACCTVTPLLSLPTT